MAKSAREIQFSTQQLVGVFLGILALGIFVFLLGISVGKKQTAIAAGAGSPAAKPESVAVRPPLSADTTRSDIQKELDAHAQADPKAASKTEPAAKPGEPAADKPAVKPTDTAAEKPGIKAEPAARKAAPAGEPASGWFIQVAAVTDKPAAASFAEKLQKDGYPALLIEPTAKDRKTIYRVRVGPYASKSEADEAKTKLTEALKKKKTDYFLVKG
jgi:cell division septation protein DedD